MAFPGASNSDFGPYLYATNQGSSGHGITRYGSDGVEHVFASFSSAEQGALKFGSGGAWGDYLYMVSSLGANGKLDRKIRFQRIQDHTDNRAFRQSQYHGLQPWRSLG